MWQRLKEILTQTDQSSAGQPVIHEVLTRSSQEVEEFQSWNQSVYKSATLEWLRSNFESYFNGGKTDRSIAFLNTPSKKGFVLYLTDKILEVEHPEFLMDFIKERVTTLGYTLYTSDLKIYSKGEDVETQQRHYLKPPMKFVPNQKLSQLFGNVEVDYILRNDEPYMFKFSATTYQDHMFQDADAFDQLMRLVFVD